jgi:hypothetical protein
MQIDRYDDGAPSWIELSTPDLDSAARFYGELFGWQARAGAPGRDQGITFLAGGQPVAAAVTGPGRAVWTTFVNVADLDKTVARVEAAGGRLAGDAADWSPAGRAAVFADPAGVRFAAWQAGTHPGAGRTGEQGTFSWGELITDDVDASLAFYGSVYGWTLSAPAGPLQRREWLLGGRPASGLLPRPPAMPAEIPPYWDVYLAVADATAATARAVALGATSLMPPTATEHGTIAVFADPAGGAFTAIQPVR